MTTDDAVNLDRLDPHDLILWYEAGCKGTISDCTGQQKVAFRTAAVDDQEERTTWLQYPMHRHKELAEPSEICTPRHPVVMLIVVDSDVIGRRRRGYVDRFRRHGAQRVEAIIHHDQPTLTL